MILLPGQFKLYLRDWKHLNKASSYFIVKPVEIEVALLRCFSQVVHEGEILV
jgi:hypothetical protein